jgi:hypothetical protein
VTDSAPELNMPQAKQIRSSNAGGRKLQVFQGPGTSFSFELSLRSSVVKGVYLTCANTFAIKSLEDIDQAIKVCDTLKIIKKL